MYILLLVEHKLVPHVSIQQLTQYVQYVVCVCDQCMLVCSQQQTVIYSQWTQPQSVDSSANKYTIEQ